MCGGTYVLKSFIAISQIRIWISDLEVVLAILNDVSLQLAHSETVFAICHDSCTESPVEITE